MMNKRVTMLDLFSGIGGLSLALHTVARTVGYCDIQPRCRDILRANMNCRRIDRAPILEGITKMHMSDLPEDFIRDTVKHVDGSSCVALGITHQVLNKGRIDHPINRHHVARCFDT